MTYNTSHLSTACDISIAETVDDTRIVIKETYDTTGIFGTADGTAAFCDFVIPILIFSMRTVGSQHAAVVDAGLSLSHVTDGSYSITTEDDIVDDDILDDGTVSIGHQCSAGIVDGVELTVYDTREWVLVSTYGFIDVKAFL